MKNLDHGGLRRRTIGVLVGAFLAGISATTAGAAIPCVPGDEACPVILKMKPGAASIKASGVVSGQKPNFYFKFAANAGQKLTINVVGGDIKTGPGIPITFPDGSGDAVFEDTPYALPAAGTYTLVLHANTMSDGPFGRFVMTLTIK